MKVLIGMWEWEIGHDVTRVVVRIRERNKEDKGRVGECRLTDTEALVVSRALENEARKI